MELNKRIKDNPLLYKSFLLSLEIINIYKYLIHEKKEFVMSKQLLKSGTSIGANSNEAVGGQSKKDFIAKLGIARKEGNETDYWLNLLSFSGYINEEKSKRSFELLSEVMKLICSSIITAKSNLGKKNND